MNGKKTSSSLVLVLGLAACLVPSVALAFPVGGPLVGFGSAMLDFLTGTLGPIVFGIGLAVAAFSLVFGSRDGLIKAVYAIAGGALLFSVGAVVSFIASIAH